MEKLIVTGGCGFIGSEFVRQFQNKYEIFVIDSLTYAGNLKNIEGCAVEFFKEDIRDEEAMEKIFKEVNPDYVVNFAAESHVDRSIDSDLPFVATNTYGTAILLNMARRYQTKRFLHVSTDEVYGQIKNGSFSESDKLNPRNPYSASKTSAEHLVQSYHITHKLDTVITRGANTYGPRQFPEKLVPVSLDKLFTLNPKTLTSFNFIKHIRII